MKRSYLISGLSKYNFLKILWEEKAVVSSTMYCIIYSYCNAGLYTTVQCTVQWSQAPVASVQLSGHLLSNWPDEKDQHSNTGNSSVILHPSAFR